MPTLPLSQRGRRLLVLSSATVALLLLVAGVVAGIALSGRGAMAGVRLDPEAAAALARELPKTELHLHLDGSLSEGELGGEGGGRGDI